MIKKTIEMISVPTTVGTMIRGSQHAPSVLRSVLESMLGLNLSHENWFGPELKDSMENHSNSEKELYKICKALKVKVEKTIEGKKFPLVLGGDHSIAIGSILGAWNCAEHHKKNLGILWVDAHPDMNTPATTISGNIHGMALATFLGMGPSSLLTLTREYSFIKAENVIILGLRSIDPGEQAILDKSGVHYYRMDTIRNRGKDKVLQELNENFLHKFDCIHLSFDLDVMDPSIMPAVNTPVESGMTMEEVSLFLGALKSSGKMCSMDLVEYNPLKDKSDIGKKTIKEILEKIF